MMIVSKFECNFQVSQHNIGKRKSIGVLSDSKLITQIITQQCAEENFQTEQWKSHKTVKLEK